MARKQSSKKTVGKSRAGKSTVRKPTKTQARTKVRTGTGGVERTHKRAEYPEDFKDECVAMYEEIHSVREVCKMFSIEPRRLKSWIKKAGLSLHTDRAIGSAGTDSREQSAVAPTHDAKNKTGTPLPTPSTQIKSDGKFISHDERKQSLDHLFTVLDNRVRTEGASMSASALKALATGMAIVSDKLDLLNRKEIPSGALPTGTSGMGTELPSNVKRLLPKPKELMNGDADKVVDGEVIYEGDVVGE